jgi:starch-binding outer membrane protein SusE/F
MKNYSRILFLLTVVAFWFVGCKKDENRNFFLGGTNPVISADRVNVVLTPQTENERAIRFNWTNPNYKFGTGVSSHDVQYTLEFDVNSNFNSANKYQTTIAKDLGISYTVFDLNKILGNDMRLPLDVDVTVFVRVISSLRFEGAVNGSLPSNVISFRTRPFSPPPTVEVPVNGELWMVGDATSMGWNIGIPDPYRTNLKFSRVSNTLYEGTFALPGGGGFKLIQEVGSWGSQFHRVTGTWESGTFRKADSEPGFIGPPTAGNYKMTVNFQDGTYTMVRL